MNLSSVKILLFLYVISISVLAQAEVSCWEQWTKRNCSNTDKAANITCTESKRIYEECLVGKKAERERKKREKEAAYKDKKRAEIEAVEKANNALKKTHTLNGSQH